MTEAEAITRALGGTWRGHTGTARCPAHDDRSPSLSLGIGTGGRLLLRCHAGCGFADIVAALRAAGHLGAAPRYLGRYAGGNPAEDARRKARERNHIARRSRQARTLWNAALPITGTPAERYVRIRGITAPLPPTLRYIPCCWHQSARRAPAMIAYVSGADGHAVHRTYLRPDGSGKAALYPPKAMLGQTRGGAVRLSDGGQRLVVAEGIETGLSLLSGLVAGAVSVWAALSTSGMQALRLPDRPGQLLIAPDGDDTGRAAAHALAERAHAHGWDVAMMPAPAGQDWNDVLAERAVA